MMHAHLHARDNPYIPFDAKVIAIEELSEDSKKFKLELSKQFSYEPGQFVKITLYGVGEAAIGITDTVADEGFELAVRNTGGLVTSALHNNTKVGDIIGIRGPFGRPFPLKMFKGKNIMFVGAGIGLWPIRSCVKDILNNRSDYGQLEMLVGAREPKLLTFNEDMVAWMNREDMKVQRTVDFCCPEDNWKENVGLITKLTDEFDVGNPENWVVLMCGPPVALKFIARSLNKKGLTDDQIWVSLERRMQCGIGKCNHCLISGTVYVCTDGPVFTMAEIKSLPGALD